MKALALFGTFFVPAFAFAQTSPVLNSVQDVGDFLTVLINNVAVPLIFTLAFLYFLWGVFRYLIQGAADAEKREEGAKMVLWAIIGFFVMISVWGLVRILTGTFRTDSNESATQRELPNAPPVNQNRN
jgi:Type IV secretion system pilin